MMPSLANCCHVLLSAGSSLLLVLHCMSHAVCASEATGSSYLFQCWTPLGIASSCHALQNVAGKPFDPATNVNVSRNLYNPRENPWFGASVSHKDFPDWGRPHQVRQWLHCSGPTCCAWGSTLLLPCQLLVNFMRQTYGRRPVCLHV